MARGTVRARGRRGRMVVAGALVCLGLGSCTEEPPRAETTGTVPGDPRATAAPQPDADSVVGMFAGEHWFAGTVPDQPHEAQGEPIRIGHINQEDVPIGSFPEVRLGAETAVAFVNAELGGVGGRPV